MNYEEEIKKLLQTPRVYWLPLEKDNTVNGLIDLCLKYIKPSDYGVEVGSFSGVSSRVIALHCKHLDCVDPWSWSAVEEAEKMFNNILENYLNITKVKKTSIEAASQYEDRSIDFVYIDADHTYEAVTQDITAWKKKVKFGGYIAGHDSYMEEVLSAVRNNIGEPIEIFSDTSWIVQVK